MRIVYVIDGLGPGGAERSLAAMSPHLVDAGIDLHVVLLHEREGFLDEVLAAGAKVHSIADAQSRVAWFTRLRAVLRSVEPVLVHTTLFDSDVVGRVAARRAHIPVVSSLVNEQYGIEQRAEFASRRWRLIGAQALDAATARFVTRFHAVSTPVADIMAGRLHVNRDKIDVIPRGRDRRSLGENTTARRRAARTQLGVADDTPVVLNVARQDHAKGLDMLLEAWPATVARVPDAILLLCGREGTRTQLLNTIVDRLDIGSSVRFLGVRADVADLMCAADVFAFPSRREGLPGAVLEAMALSVPIVATGIAATRDALPDDRYALLVPVDDREALSAGLSDALLDRDAARKRARRSRERFDTMFTIEAVTQQMVDFYSRVVADHG